MASPELSTKNRIVERMAREGRRPAEQGLLDHDVIRAFVSLALALGFTLTMFQINWLPDTRIGWEIARANEQISFDLLPELTEESDEEAVESDGGVPITKFQDPTETSDATTVEPLEPGASNDTKPSAEATDQARLAAHLRQMPVLQFAEQQPNIIGGLRGLYLRIHYPKAAQDAGIQGLVVVRFVVELDGSATDIEVVKSLHPLCDNAAVKAISETRFTPARQNGQRVRVRMNLPIRFVLINEPSTDEPAAPSR